MPDIKLRDGSGVEQTYTGVDTITVPLADGTGTWTYGLTDEDLTFSDGQYLITNANYKLFKKYLHRIKINIKQVYTGKKVVDCENLCSSGDIVDLSKLIIDCQGADIFDGAFLINNCNNLEKLPKIVNNEDVPIYVNPFIFNDNNKLTESEILRFISNFNKMTNNSGSSSFNSCYMSPIKGTVYNCLDLSSVYAKWHEIINHAESSNKFSNNPTYELRTANYCKSIRNIPIQYTDTTNRTSNIDISEGYNVTPFADSFAFATNNGTPYTMNWKSQTIELSHASYTFGYSKGGYSTDYSSYAQGYWKVKNNIFTSNNMTVEQAKARYDGLKTTDNWYSCCSNSVTYDGKSLNLSLLFSRYNHDSAVETINSLPDTSAYLATAGGTNTIKFRKYSGACTDGGGTNDLTAEEIAVATAKGWTVTLV